MYTSGTTGDPKGVMISNESLLVNLAGANSVIQSIGEVFDQDDVYMSYLPLAHIFDRMFEELFISHGAKIGFWRGDVKLLVDDIAALKPTVFCAVPRVLDRIYSGLTTKISSGGILKKTLFNVAYKLKLDSMRKGVKHEKASPLFDKLVFSKVQLGSDRFQNLLKYKCIAFLSPKLSFCVHWFGACSSPWYQSQ
jgi:long-chain acyl-CoA synthetase